jgi:hypothetical protein
MLSKGTTIAFVARQGAVEEKQVRVGKQSDKWVQILSGLSEGEEVLLAPPPGFTPQKADEESGAAGDTDKEKASPHGADGAPVRGGPARRSDGPKPDGAPRPGEASKAGGGDGSQAAAQPSTGEASAKPAPAGAAGASGGSGTR